MNEAKKSLIFLTEWVLEKSSFSDEVQKSLVKDYVLWKWTAGFDEETKFQGCRFWSKQSFEKWKATCRKFKSGKKSGKFSKGKTNGLRHDHVVPRAFIFNKLRNNSNGKISGILECLSFGCVLTHDEDERLNGNLKDTMPEGWKDVWDRYRVAFRDKGITIFEISWPDAKIIKIILDMPQNES
jgi:hypothetical protein